MKFTKRFAGAAALLSGDFDYERCAKILLDEFRGGKLGRISLEEP